MKKFTIIMLFMLMCAVSFGAFTTTISNRRTYKNSYRWTGKPKDKLLLWAQEVENRLDGTSAIEFTFYTPTDTEPATNEGTVYYDLSEHKLKFRNASSWVAIEAGSSGNSLDGAYDIGRSITVDAGVVTLTGTNAADNIVLAIVQADTGSTVAQTITSAGTGALLTFDSNSSGGDILGSDSSWSISKAGAFVINGSITLSTADVLFDSTAAGKDVQFDESAQMMHFLDAGAASAILGFGGSADGSADISFIYDGSGDDLNITGSGKEIAFGATGNAGMDIVIWGLSGDLATFGEDESALSMTDYDIWMDDTADFFIGGTKNVGFLLAWDSSKTMSILAGAASDDFTLNIGKDQQGVDLGLYGSTASSKVLWDADADKMIFDGADIRLQDGDISNFGDSDDFFMTATNQAFTFGSLTTNESSIYSFGANTDGDDVKMFGATTGEYWLWDAGADSILPVCGNALYTLTDAEADQFKVNATGTTSGNAIHFLTTDGRILLDSNGGSNGDIELNSADDLVFTSAGKVTITNGSEPMTVSGALTVAGVATFNGSIVGDGATTVVGTKAVETTDIDNETVTIAQSGTVFNNTGDADGTTFTLPEASTALGCWYTFVVSETGQQITVDLDNADVFLHLSLGAGDKMTSSTLGDTITVSAVSDSQWGIISVYPLAADWADGGA